VFAALAENATIQAWVAEAGEGSTVREAVQSMTKMHGFVDVQLSNPEF